MKEIIISDRQIGPNHSPYIIAEMSANHNGSLERALKIIKAAKDAGADAVKLQTYKAETMTLDVDQPHFQVQGNNPWRGRKLFDLYREASTPWEWHKRLFEYGREIGITIFSTPFDASAVDLLESLNTPAYKIASFELVHHELIKKCASTGKTVIMSTGMASLEEIAEAVTVARQANVTNLILLKCTSAYPAPPEEINLKTIPHLSQAFGVLTGLSDHTMGIGVPIAATAMGATVIEKHFTLSRADGGVDASFSLEPDELKELIVEIKNAHAALGQVSYTSGELESSFKKYRRSLFFIKDLPAGSEIKIADVQALRPGEGLPPKFIKDVIGRKTSANVTKGTPVLWKYLS